MLVFCVGTGTDSTFALEGNSAFVLSSVDFLDGCFFASIGDGGSSVGGTGLAVDDGSEIEGVRSFAGVFGTVAVIGGVVDSV